MWNIEHSESERFLVLNGIVVCCFCVIIHTLAIHCSTQKKTFAETLKQKCNLRDELKFSKYCSWKFDMGPAGLLFCVNLTLSGQHTYSTSMCYIFAVKTNYLWTNIAVSIVFTVFKLTMTIPENKYLKRMSVPKNGHSSFSAECWSKFEIHFTQFYQLELRLPTVINFYLTPHIVYFRSYGSYSSHHIKFLILLN